MSKTLKKFVQKMGDDKGFVVAIVVALFIISYLLLSYFLVYRPIPEGYNTINMLDSQQKAVNYPEFAVLNQNSTFNVWLTVENHMGKPEKYEVLQKTTPTMDSLPIAADPTNIYQKDLADGQKWESQVTVSLNQTGHCYVVFELWMFNSATNAYELNHYNLCSLSVEVAAAT
jgi:hypothetical protein